MGFKLFQPLKARLFGGIKPRSLKQLAAYWTACKYISGQISNERKQYDKEGKHVDFMTKIAVAKQSPQIVKYFHAKDGVIYMQTISISYKNMKHLEACDYFNLAFPILADMGNMTIEQLKHEIGIDE